MAAQLITLTQHSSSESKGPAILSPTGRRVSRTLALKRQRTEPDCSGQTHSDVDSVRNPYLSLEPEKLASHCFGKGIAPWLLRTEIVHVLLKPFWEAALEAEIDAPERCWKLFVSTVQKGYASLFPSQERSQQEEQQLKDTHWKFPHICAGLCKELNLTSWDPLTSTIDLKQKLIFTVFEAMCTSGAAKILMELLVPGELCMSKSDLQFLVDLHGRVPDAVLEFMKACCDALDDIVENVAPELGLYEVNSIHDRQQVLDKLALLEAWSSKLSAPQQGMDRLLRIGAAFVRAKSAREHKRQWELVKKLEWPTMRSE